MKAPHLDPHALEAMRDDHRAFEDLFETVRSQLDTGDKSIADAGWSTLERRLTEHLALEERDLFPRYHSVDPIAVNALLADHARFRELLTELGLALELGALPDAHADEFFALLKSHAAREDEAFARWIPAA